MELCLTDFYKFLGKHGDSDVLIGNIQALKKMTQKMHCKKKKIKTRYRVTKSKVEIIYKDQGKAKLLQQRQTAELI